MAGIDFNVNVASQVSQTITDGVTTTAPSENAVFDALALKAPLASQLKATSLKTSAYSAQPGDYVPVDTTSGVVVVTLPTAPLDGTIIGIKRVVGATNIVTYICGGPDVLNVSGGSTSGSLTILNQQVTLIYKATGAIWYVETSLSVGGMDTRYLQITNAPNDISYYRKTGTTTLERWYTSAITAYSAASMNVTANFLRCNPLIISRTTTIDRLAMDVTTGGTAGSLIRLGIYSSTNNIPTTLILDAGTIAGDSATVQSITVNVTLQPGLYYLAYITNSAATVVCRGIPVAAFPSVLGIASTFGAGNSATTIVSTVTYGALPNPFDNTGISAIAVNPAAISFRIV